MDYHLRCIECNKKFQNDSLYTCPSCGGLLEVAVDVSSADFSLDGKEIRVWKYSSLLPVRIKPVTLHEGGTPLYEIVSSKKTDLYVKHEGLNPSGSFKDRGMTVGISKAVELGKSMVACASTGNTSASMAMYSARAGLKAYVFLPSGKVALGKLAQAMMHGARVIAVRGNFDTALRIVREICVRKDIYLMNSVNPFRLEGQKTIAFEIVDQLGYCPEAIYVPVGNAGNISAIFKGFSELKEAGYTDTIPKMIGVQAEGANPIYRAFSERKETIEPVENPETIATAIRIGSPVNARKALKAIYESGGRVIQVSDDEIVQAQKLLAKQGIGVEPASASSFAGFMKDDGEFESAVCIATGNLLKDPEEAVMVSEKPVEADPDIEVIERLL